MAEKEKPGQLEKVDFKRGMDLQLDRNDIVAIAVVNFEDQLRALETTLTAKKQELTKQLQEFQEIASIALQNIKTAEEDKLKKAQFRASFAFVNYGFGCSKYNCGHSRFSKHANNKNCKSCTRKQNGICCCRGDFKPSLKRCNA
jgi:hypothetical protein